MKDWTPAGRVPELSQPLQDSMLTESQAPPPPLDSYAPSEGVWSASEPLLPGEALEEISPGSEPIDIMACIKRGFTLTGRNFGMILLVGVIYVGVTIAADSVLSAMDQAVGYEPIGTSNSGSYHSSSSETGSYRFSLYQQDSPLKILLSQILSIFLSLGLTRIGLNLVSGQPVTVAMLFGGGSKLIRAAIATFLFALMVGIGLMLLVVPGIYLALRLGQFQAAIVDRNMGVIEAFKYSSSITTNNRMNLLGLALLSALIALAGCAALMLGLVFALPVIWLSWTVAYRWMQYGRRAAQDHPGTTRPMLANR